MQPVQFSPVPGRRRCLEHGLATGDDGKCTLCHREEQGERSVLGVALRVGVVIGLLGAGSYATVRFFRPNHDSEESDAVAAATAAAAEARGRTTTRARAAERLGDEDARATPPLVPSGSDDRAAGSADPTVGAPDPSSTSDDARLEAEMRRIPIKIYVTQWCPHCKRARAWLTAHQYAFTVYDVEASPTAAAEHRRLAPGGEVPVLDIEGHAFTGFSEATVERALKEQARKRLGARSPS